MYIYAHQPIFNLRPTKCFHQERVRSHAPKLVITGIMNEIPSIQMHLIIMARLLFQSILIKLEHITHSSLSLYLFISLLYNSNTSPTVLTLTLSIYFSLTLTLDSLSLYFSFINAFPGPSSLPLRIRSNRPQSRWKAR